MAETNPELPSFREDPDAVWKRTLQNEIKAANNWEEEWSFLIEEYKQLQNETAKTYVFPVKEEERKSSVDYPKYPKTTAKEIGWLASNPIYSLEKFGRYAKPIGTIYKRFGWPIEGCP
nr:uncharacterized protein C20orf85 homolog [Parasteatoda tepidariorum]